MNQQARVDLADSLVGSRLELHPIWLQVARELAPQTDRGRGTLLAEAAVAPLWIPTREASGSTKASLQDRASPRPEALAQVVLSGA